MARRDALLRLHNRMVARCQTLRKALAGELHDLRGHVLDELAGGDAADVAFHTGKGEIASQLAELEARELNQIEKALERMKQGTYGTCEGCSKKIPVARLNALPYSTTCVECQREAEQNPGWGRDGRGDDWEKVYDAESSYSEPRDINLSDIEMDFSSK